MIRQVMLYLNKDKTPVYEAAKRCVQACLANGITPVFFAQDKPELQAQMPELLPSCRLMEKPVQGMIDLLFVLGGDGTVLRALDEYVTFEIPVLGIHLGRMGFLLETQVKEIDEAVSLLHRGEYEIERRMMLMVNAQAGDCRMTRYAVNEVSISRGLSQRMIAVDARVGDELVEHYIADGVLVSSPTGSTAYSLSAGGPIIDPGMHCFLLCPICPHSLQSRPIVLSCEEPVTLKINMREEREGIQLSVDGQAIREMRNQECVKISRSPHDALLIRFKKERNFFSLLKEKLSQWSL